MPVVTAPLSLAQPAVPERVPLDDVADQPHTGRGTEARVLVDEVGEVATAGQVVAFDEHVLDGSLAGAEHEGGVGLAERPGDGVVAQHHAGALRRLHAVAVRAHGPAHVVQVGVLDRHGAAGRHHTVGATRDVDPAGGEVAEGDPGGAAIARPDDVDVLDEQASRPTTRMANGPALVTRVRRTVTPSPTRVRFPSTSSPSTTVPGSATTTDPLGRNTTPSGTPDVVASGKPARAAHGGLEGATATRPSDDAAPSSAGRSPVRPSAASTASAASREEREQRRRKGVGRETQSGAMGRRHEGSRRGRVGRRP